MNPTNDTSSFLQAQSEGGRVGCFTRDGCLSIPTPAERLKAKRGYSPTAMLQQAGPCGSRDWEKLTCWLAIV